LFEVSDTCLAPLARATCSANATIAADPQGAQILPHLHGFEAGNAATDAGDHGDERELKRARHGAVEYRHIEPMVRARGDGLEGLSVGRCVGGRPGVAVAADHVGLVQAHDGFEIAGLGLADEDLGHRQAAFEALGNS
jgi:hypothetical protein